MLFSNTIVASLAAAGILAPAALAQDTANCNHSQGEGINKDITCRPVQGCPPAPGNALRLEGNEAYFPNITDGGISPIRTINIPEGGVGFQFVSNDGYFNCLAQFSESVSDTLLTLSPNGTFTAVWGDGSSRVGGCVKVPGDIAGQK